MANDHQNGEYDICYQSLREPRFGAAVPIFYNLHVMVVGEQDSLWWALHEREIREMDEVFKGTRWMPWHQEAMKDVGACDKPRRAGKRATTRGFPNGETQSESCRTSQ